jgi:hypothetical protein
MVREWINNNWRKRQASLSIWQRSLISVCKTRTLLVLTTEVWIFVHHYKYCICSTTELTKLELPSWVCPTWPISHYQTIELPKWRDLTCVSTWKDCILIEIEYKSWRPLRDVQNWRNWLWTVSKLILFLHLIKLLLTRLRWVCITWTSVIATLQK